MLILSSASDNAKSSPFLRLPPEIRCRIYEYVLGGNTIYIVENKYAERGWPLPTRLAVCRCPGEFDNVTDTWQRVPESRKANPHRTYKHWDCIQEDNILKTMPLDVIRVSRQVYHEAALLPFASNKFVLGLHRPGGNSKDIEPFVASLIPAQVRAITHLIVDRGNLFNLCSIPYNLIPRLTGLKHLQLIIMKQTHKPHGIPELRRTLRQSLDTCFFDFRPFCGLSLTEVDIAVLILAMPQAPDMIEDNVPDVVWAWREDAKKDLLMPLEQYQAEIAAIQAKNASEKKRK